MLFAGQHIAKSPFEVYVDKSQGDASKVTAQGPGLEPSGNIANKTTYFEIFTAGEGRLLSQAGLRGEPLGPGSNLEVLGAKPLYFAAGAGTGEVEVMIQDPAGQKGTVEPQLEARGDSTYRCSYQPTVEGVHTVHVTFAGVPIPRSPFTVTVGQGRLVWATPLLEPPVGGAAKAGPTPTLGLCFHYLGALSLLPCGGPSSSSSRPSPSLSLFTLSSSEELAPAV